MAKQVARIGNTIDIKTDVSSRFWPLNVLRVGVETARVVLVDIRDNDTVFDWHPSSGTELTIGGVVQDNEASDAIEVAATLIRDLVHGESGGGPETDTAALAAVDALAASRGQGVDAATLNTATGEKFRLETVGPRTITGPLTSIEVYNATNEPIDVQGVEVEANSGKTLTRPSATSNVWSDFMAAILLLLTFAVSGVVAQEIPAEYLPAIQTSPVTQQSEVGILSAAQLQSYTTAERDALQLTANERRLVWNLDTQQIEQWDGATWGPIGQGEIELSTEPGQIATLDSQGRILVREGGVTSFKNVVPEVANIPGNATGVFSTTFTPVESTGYVFRYSGDLQSGTAGISVGTTVGGTELFVSNPASGDADGSRLTLTRQTNFTPQIPLTAGVPYSITQWVGGGGHILNHTVCTDEIEVDRFGPSTDANNVLTAGTDGLAFYNPNALNLVKGSATNTTGTSPANPGEVIQFTFTVPTDDTYTITETLDSIAGGVPAQHGAGLGISLTPPTNPGVIAGFDFFSTNSDRLTEALSPRGHELSLSAGVTYYGTAYPGANQTVTNYCLEITGDSIATPTGSVVHSIVQTDNIDDSTVGSKITIVTGTAVHLGTQEVTFATNGDITLPQQPQPYILKWYGGFDMDGDPDQETRVAFTGPTLYSLDATADAFDTTVEGSDDNSGANTTFSIFQWMRPVAIAVIDASAGPVTTSLTFTEGGADVGPTGGTIEISQVTRAVTIEPATEVQTSFNLLSDIPSPATFNGGDVLTVTADPVTENNGTYLVLGTVGQPGTSIIPN